MKRGLDPPVARNDVLLHRQLDPVGDRLERTVGADLHGAEPTLDVSGDLAFGPDGPKSANRFKKPKTAIPQTINMDDGGQKPSNRSTAASTTLDQEERLDDRGRPARGSCSTLRLKLTHGGEGGSPRRVSRRRVGLQKEKIQRSTSPITISKLPMNATTSASMESPLATRARREH